MIRLHNKKKGFSLFELAVVLVVVGIIVFIAVRAIKGAQGAMVHIKWQGAIDDAYQALVDYTVVKGHLPPQVEFPLVFNQLVDDYNYGGTVGYALNPANSAEVTNTTSSDVGAICSLTEAGVGGADQPIFTLTENTAAVRPEQLKPRQVTLSEFQASLKCLPNKRLLIQEPVTAISKPNKKYALYLYASGGVPTTLGVSKEYQWCVEVPVASKLKCAKNGTTTVSVPIISLFDTFMTGYTYPNGDTYIKPLFANDCMNTAGWTRREYLDIHFSQFGGNRAKLGSMTIPMKIFVKDAKNNIAVKYVDFVHDGPYVTTDTTCSF